MILFKKIINKTLCEISRLNIEEAIQLIPFSLFNFGTKTELVKKLIKIF